MNPVGDTIRLSGLRAVGYHGVLRTERETGQEFRADVVLHLDTRPAARTDDLDRTVSYADVAEDVVAVLAGEPVDLVETLADRVAAVVLARPGVRAVEVTVHKPQAPIPVEFDDVEITIHRSRAEPSGPAARDVEEPARTVAPEQVVLALGANLGDRTATLRSAVDALAHAEGLHLTGVSPLARTAAVLAPGQDPQPDYLNAVLTGTTTLAPGRLLELVHAVEDAHGRTRTERWGARTLDVDVVAVGDRVIHDPDLTLPHPRAHERAFVLAPWARLDPDAVLPGPHGGPVAVLAAAAPDRHGLTWLDGDWRTADVEDGGP
ncbi:2-amino-4-hydroxy-6-hydroxymethyldihydropteridine diphosphokinase [Georgenia alba]|uniref:Bifunctional folate synthesis protein n=1 Tax=Georgenia alba TaxID=2233858 RepID=A0ABW2QEW6_9MICO